MRVVDARGCQHYAFVNGAGLAATANDATITLNTVGGDPPVLTPVEDQSTCGASEQEEVSINPVHRVRWWIGPTTVALQPDPAIEVAAGVEGEGPPRLAAQISGPYVKQSFVALLAATQAQRGARVQASDGSPR